MDKILKYKTDIILFILLISIGVKYVYDFNSYLDIQLKDETLYLQNGLYLLKNGLPDPQWAPVYSVWFFLLSIIQNDSVAIYFLNLQILTVVPSLILYVLLRVLKVSHLISFLIGFFFLISSGNILVNPKVTHFALIIITSSSLLFYLTKKYMIKWSVIILGSLLSAYVRPELSISFVLIIIYFLLSALKNKVFVAYKKGIGLLGIIIIIIIFVFGNPLGSGKRSLGAFSQHFSLNWVEWNKSKLNPWTDAHDIVRDNFGEINSIFEAPLANPDLFFKHIFQNISLITSEFQKLVNHTVFTTDNYRFENIGIYSLLFIILMYTIINLYNSKLSILDLIKANYFKNKQVIVILTLFMIPMIISVVLIYPRLHYLLILLFVLIIIHTPLIRVNYNYHKWQKMFSAIFLILIAVTFLVITPSPKKYYTLHSQNNLETIKFLRSLEIQSKVNILEDNGGYYTYLGSNYSWIRERDKVMSFDQFLETFRINLIVSSGKLNGNRKFYSDEAYIKFLNDFTKYGFVKMIIPDSGNELYIKNYLLNQSL